MNKRTKIIEWVTVYTMIFIVFAIGTVALGISVKVIQWILMMLGVI